MTFSKEVKREILSTFAESNYELSVICGAILSAGSLVISNKKMSFTISSEIFDYVKQIEDMISRLTGEKDFSITSKKNKYTKHDVYSLSVPAVTGEEILLLCGVIYRDEIGRLQLNHAGDEHLFNEDKSRIAFLSSAFIGSGSVSIPGESENETKKNSGYHMEWKSQTQVGANRIAEVLATFDILSKKVERNNEQIVYVKEADTISDILKLLGASKAVLELENERVSRDVRNLANRQANCTVANIEKSISAAQKQLDAIETIMQTIGVENLPDTLSEIALARLANPESTLTELGNMLKKPISRGAVNQRFNKLLEIAKEVGNG